jgi:O-antigen ligase/tetratricopeptide (TPR) repeat protein
MFALVLFLSTALLISLFNKNSFLYKSNLSSLKNPFVYFYAVYIVITGISIFFATSRNEAIYEFLKVTSFFILFLFIYLYIVRYERSFEYLNKFIIALSFIISLIGLIQYLEILGQMGFSLKTAYEVKGNSAHKNLYSQMLFITFSFSLIGIYNFKQVWRNLSYASALINILIIILLMTRSVWFGLILASLSTLIIFFVTGLHKKVDKDKLKPLVRPIIIVSGIGLLIFLAVLFADSNKTVSSHIKEGTDFTSGNTFHRLHLWNKTMDLALEQPLTGVGAGNWKIDIVKKGTSISSGTGWKNAVRAHSDYLWVFAESGIFGILTYLMLFILPWFFIIKYIKKSEDPDKSITMLLLFFAIVGYSTYSMFSFPKERIEHQIMINIIFGFFIYETHRLIYNEKQSDKPKSKNIIQFVGIILLLFMLVQTYASYKRIQAEKGVNKTFALKKLGKFKEVISITDEIYSPFSTLDYAANSILLNKGAAFDQLKKPLHEVTNVFLDALEDHPYNLRALNSLVYCYSKAENYKEAEKYCLTALKYTPNDLNTTINYAKLTEKVHGVDSAFSILNTTKGNKKHKGYITYRNNLLQKKLFVVYNKTKNKKLRNALQKKSKNFDLLNKAYNRSIKKNTKFEKEFLVIILSQKNFKHIKKNKNIIKLLAEYD